MNDIESREVSRSQEAGRIRKTSLRVKDGIVTIQTMCIYSEGDAVIGHSLHSGNIELGELVHALTAFKDGAAPRVDLDVTERAYAENGTEVTRTPTGQLFLNRREAEAILETLSST